MHWPIRFGAETLSCSRAPSGVAAEHGNQRDGPGVGLLESVDTSEGAGRRALMSSKDSQGTFIGWIIVGIAAVLRLGWLDLAAYQYDEADVLLRVFEMQRGQIPLSG